jgi:hypothetical protein
MEGQAATRCCNLHVCLSACKSSIHEVTCRARNILLPHAAHATISTVAARSGSARVIGSVTFEVASRAQLIACMRALQCHKSQQAPSTHASDIEQRTWQRQTRCVSIGCVWITSGSGWWPSSGRLGEHRCEECASSDEHHRLGLVHGYVMYTPVQDRVRSWVHAVAAIDTFRSIGQLASEMCTRGRTTQVRLGTASCTTQLA